MMASALTEGHEPQDTRHFIFRVAGSFPVTMVQNVTFRYTKDGPCIYRSYGVGLTWTHEWLWKGPVE